MRGNTLDALTLNLFYATDFWDRLEKNIVPALRTGMVALVDRYIFSIIARARVRGVPARWLNDVFDFALVPDLVLYLDVDVEHLLPRVLSVRQLDHWESGEDFLRGPDLYDNFIRYQGALIEEFRSLAKHRNFVTVDGRGSVGDVFQALKTEVQKASRGWERHKPYSSQPGEGQRYSAKGVKSVEVLRFSVLGQFKELLTGSDHSSPDRPRTSRLNFR